jgi:hypothetical protein
MTEEIKKELLNSPLWNGDINKVDWDYVSANYNMSEEFIEFYQDKLNWSFISCNGNLSMSENFIDRHKDKLNWKYISCMVLSDEFVVKHTDKINIDHQNWARKNKYIKGGI